MARGEERATPTEKHSESKLLPRNFRNCASADKTVQRLGYIPGLYTLRDLRVVHPTTTETLCLLLLCSAGLAVPTDGERVPHKEIPVNRNTTESRGCPNPTLGNATASCCWVCPKIHTGCKPTKRKERKEMPFKGICTSEQELKAYAYTSVKNVPWLCMALTVRFNIHPSSLPASVPNFSIHLSFYHQ